MRTKLVNVHTVKSHLIAQFDKFNGHPSVAVSWVYSLVNSSFAGVDGKNVHGHEFEDDCEKQKKNTSCP